MAYVQHGLEALQNFLPEGSYNIVVDYLLKYKIQLKLTKARKSILGQYQHDLKSGKNSISINGDLEPYNFLLTLAHEIAHCVCYNKYGNTVLPHGDEWQLINGVVLKELLDAKIFPSDIELVLQRSLYTQRASCTDAVLESVLLRYDKSKQHLLTIASLPVGTPFAIADGTQFVIQEKRRTRYLCLNLSNKKQFLFPASYKVTKIDEENNHSD
jgi:SprT protein